MAMINGSHFSPPTRVSSHPANQHRKRGKCPIRERVLIGLLLLCCDAVPILHGQKAPQSYEVPENLQDYRSGVTPHGGIPKREAVDASKIYALSELVDLAERNNPTTHEAWERAKVEAQSLRVARAAFYPTLSVAAVGNTERRRILFGSDYYRQSEGIWRPETVLDYTVFDFGNRGSQIDLAKARLLSANCQFNDVHRILIFQVTTNYYRLLDALGHKDAAEATLLNAQTVQQAVEERLKNGLATLPDVLEARAATARAVYELATVAGDERIARGQLAESLGVSPDSQISVQGLSELHLPEDLDKSFRELADRAVSRRPDLLKQTAAVRAAEADAKQVHSTFLPTLSFSGRIGFERVEGQQDLMANAYTGGETWNANLRLNWRLFDGGAREGSLVRAKSSERAERAKLQSDENRVFVEVWNSHSEFQTSLTKQKAADALLIAASQSYDAALEAYKYGVRNFLDLVSAQRALAQARTDQVSARIELLTKYATLEFQTGDILSAPKKMGMVP